MLENIDRTHERKGSSGDQRERRFDLPLLFLVMVSDKLVFPEYLLYFINQIINHDVTCSPVESIIPIPVFLLKNKA